MARIQILELPEGGSDDRPPFILVVDESVPQRYILGPDDNRVRDYWQDIADKVGARGVIVTPETVDIPANDVPPAVDEAFKSDIENWAAGTNETIMRIVEAMSGGTKRTPSPRPRSDGQRLADERTDIARDMDRLAKWKTELADALRIYRSSSWNDIRNTIEALRNERDEQAAEVERLRAGEESVTDERIAPNPGQWIWKWNRATPEKRLDMAAQILDGMSKANTCFMSDHETQIAHLRAELDRLLSESTGTANPDA